MPIDLSTYGFTDRFAALAAAYPALSPARVVSQEKGLYGVVSEAGEGLAEVAGKLRHAVDTVSDYPAVGDFVMLSPNENGSAPIQTVLPRKSLFVRKAAGSAHEEQAVAANIDVVFVCMSLNNDFNLRRLERYLTIGWDSGATPVVLLTKADLCADVQARLREAESVAMGADVLTVSSLATDGLLQALPYMKPGRTIALLGSSGVGKSTLINRLLGEERIGTNGLRNDDKGRHTTTHRSLFLLPNGGMLIDTPGMRELGLWDVGEGLDKTFADVTALAEGCRFADCTHTTEPGCAVRRAIEGGELSAARWASYQKLKTENAIAEDAGGYLAAKEKKRKEIAMINKNNQQYRGEKR